LTIASFADADVLTGPDGLLVERGDTTEELAYPAGPSGWDAVLDELAASLASGRPPTHDGRWGVATLEVCAAVEAAAATGKEVVLEGVA
jgi:phthalate 4,5-cis-dihydrodiol dehydrogenase